MLIFYRLLLDLAYFFVYPIGTFKAACGNQLWQGRLGSIKRVGPCDLWLHAASVGEVRVIGYLISYLRDRRPEIRIHVTTMTTAGFNTAASLYQWESLSISYFPLDASIPMKRAFKAVEPKILAIAETEIWPTLISVASDSRIPLVLFNGRMSSKAFPRYRLLGRTFAKLLSRYEHFILKTQEDAARYQKFNIPTDKITVAGDMKFDAPVRERNPRCIAEIRERLGVPPEAFLFVAGSTRSGEEEILTKMYTKLKQEIPSLVMILAPRHLDRLEEVKTLLSERNVAFSVYSTIPSPRQGDVILVDSLGLLNDLYSAANASFVGGTLVDIGGHNLLEPVWCGCPVLFGPSLENVREAAEYIETNNFGGMVNDADDLFSRLKKMAAGNIMYNIKESHQQDNSATTLIGDYLLKRLGYA